MFTVTPLKNGRTCSANRSHPYDAFQKFDDAIGRFCHAPPSSLHTFRGKM